MASNKFAVLYGYQEIALYFTMINVLDCIMDKIKHEDIHEMYLLDEDSENYYLVSDLDNYTSIKDIIKTSVENGNLSMVDFDIQLKNGISIYTHDNLTIEAPDEAALFKYVDYIFRFFHLEAAKCKEIIISSPDELVEFDVN